MDALRDHEPAEVTRFKGLFSRGTDESVPEGHFIDTLNTVFFEGGVESRYGTSSLGFPVAAIVRTRLFKRIGEAARLIILDNTGKLWDSTNLAAPILNIAAMADFAMVVMFNRAYISPHNGIRGLAGEKVYVYDGTTCRPAAGTSPTVAPSVTYDAAGGNLDEGLHAYAICFETDTGFITAPSPITTLNHYLTEEQIMKVVVYDIPIGPPGTVARRIVVTKTISETYTGNYTDLEFFFLPNGRIGNNTATQLGNIEFFDSELMDSADRFKDALPEIPAGVAVGEYKGRLVVAGENANDCVARISPSGDPEVMDDLEGFVTVNPGDAGGGIKGIVEWRMNLYFIKSQRAHSTSDNGQNPAYWEVSAVDSSTGCECNGVARMLDLNKADMTDTFFIASYSGIRAFNGVFTERELTWKIEDIWKRINFAVFNKVELAIDPIRKIIYAALPLDAASSPSHLLVGDFSDGMSWESVSWSLWSFPYRPTSIMVDVDWATKQTVLKFGSLDNGCYKYDTGVRSDIGTAINSYVHSHEFPGDGYICHWGAIKTRARGSGTLNLTVYGMNRTTWKQLPSLSLQPLPGKTLLRGMNFKDEYCSVKLGTNNGSDYFRLLDLVVFKKPLWRSRVGL